MSLATRCTSCGTIFRVVQDQLRVSEGWVRCGRCDEVFNAREGLFDLEREAPPPWQPASTQQVMAELAQRRKGGFGARSDDHEVTELDEDDRIASRFFHPEQDDVHQSPAHAVAERDRRDFADARFNTDLLGETEATADPDVSGAEVAQSPEPAFVRAADRQARWNTRGARWAMSLASVVLLGLLALQAAHHWRDSLSAQWPQTRPWLIGWCALAGCGVEAPRRIEDISVENTALTHAVPGTDSFRLAVTLRNRGGAAVRTPSIDLSLTDTQGQLIARRALNPGDFGVSSTVIGAGAETALQTLISAGNPRVVGYTVEVFYP